jgi:transposase
MLSERSITHWVLQYNEGGFTALKTKPSGRPKGDHKWPADIFTDLCTEIDKGGYWSIPRMQKWLKEHRGKDIPEQTVWVRMDKLKYSYKSSRPSPVQGDAQKQESFKKGDSLRSWSR